MKRVFVLDKQDVELGRAEVSALCGSNGKLYDGLLVVDCERGLDKRLAYCHRILEFVCRCKNIEWLSRVDWKSYYRKSFCVRSFGCGVEKEVAGIIYRKLGKGVKVDLKSPGMLVEIYKVDDGYVVGILENEVSKDFMKRRAHMRPELYPIASSPKLTRAGINLIGISGKETLLDPFCGTGTTLIEGKLMGLKVAGYDIDSEMVEKSRKNLEHYGLRAKVECKDATKLNVKYDYIFTDLPYARGGRNINLISTYKEFFKASYKYIKKRMVVVFPDFVDYRKVVGKWKVRLCFKQYIHKSLSKNIVMLEK